MFVRTKPFCSFLSPSLSSLPPSSGVSHRRVPFRLLPLFLPSPISAVLLSPFVSPLATQQVSLSVLRAAVMQSLDLTRPYVFLTSGKRILLLR